jgi:hypothetical protein
VQRQEEGQPLTQAPEEGAACHTTVAGGREASRHTFEWAIVTAEGDMAAQLARVQARVIKEVLQWLSSRPPSRSTDSVQAREVGSTDR